MKKKNKSARKHCVPLTSGFVLFDVWKRTGQQIANPMIEVSR